MEQLLYSMSWTGPRNDNTFLFVSSVEFEKSLLSPPPAPLEEKAAAGWTYESQEALWMKVVSSEGCESIRRSERSTTDQGRSLTRSGRMEKPRGQQ
jgi:hypothetical protein